MRYLKPEQRFAWMVSDFVTPLTELHASIETWNAHAARYLAEGNVAKAKSAFWQTAQSGDVLYTRLTDMERDEPWMNGKRETPGMTADELWEVYGESLRDYIDEQWTVQLRRFQDAGVPEGVFNDFCMRYGMRDCYTAKTVPTPREMYDATPYLSDIDLSDPANPVDPNAR